MRVDAQVMYIDTDYENLLGTNLEMVGRLLQTLSYRNPVLHAVEGEHYQEVHHQADNEERQALRQK